MDCGNGAVDRRTQPFDDLIDVRFANDERRREQDVIAAHAVDRAAQRIAKQALAHRGRLDLRMQARFGVERLLGLALLYELDAGEQSASANVADVRMSVELRVECAKQVSTLPASGVEQVVAL